jgi:hypothetical protein
MLRVITTPATAVRPRAAAITVNMMASVRLKLAATTSSRVCMVLDCFMVNSATVDSRRRTSSFTGPMAALASRGVFTVPSRIAARTLLNPSS